MVADNKPRTDFDTELNPETLRISKQLYDRGFFIVAIRPPTVPAGSARLRVSVQSEHTKEQLDGLCDAIEEIVGHRG